MTLDEARGLIEKAESFLDDSVFVVACVFERNGKKLEVAITQRLRNSCKKGRVWKSKPMLTAFKNAEYGFDKSHVKSSGGHDGIFMMNRDYRPKNAMMKKLFDKLLDKTDSGAVEIANELEVDLVNLIPVRLVSHHMRLLGILKDAEKISTLVLVDYDDTK